MAEARTFQAKIELMGKMHASLSGAVRMAQGQLNRLAMSARKIGAAIGQGFAKMGAMVKSFAGQIIGLTLAYAGLRSASEFISKSKEQYKANQEAVEMLNATLANNPKIVKMGADAVASQQKRFSDLADNMQEASVFASSMWREAFTGLAQWGAGAKDAEALSGSINNILAAKGGLKATASDAKALGDTLGKIVASGKFGKFAKEYGLSKDDEKRFKAMRTSAERIAELNRIISTKYGGRAAALGATEAGEIRKAENTIADFQSRMGKGFMKIEGDWIKFVSRMVPIMEPAVEGMTALFHEGMKGIIGFLEKDFVPAFTQLGVDPEIVAGWQEFSDVAGELGDALSPIVGWVKDLVGLDTSATFKDFIKAEVLATIRETSAVLGTIKGFLDWIGGFKWPEWKLPEIKWPEPPGWLKWIMGGGEEVKGMGPKTEAVTAAATKTHARGMPIAEAAVPEFPPIEFDVVTPDFVPIEKGVDVVTAAAENTSKAFGGWTIPGALMSGLDAVANKAREVGNIVKGALAGGHAASETPMQHGGIVTGPTRALIGEAGPEAVIPLGGPLGAAANLGKAMEALWRGGSRNVSYAPNITVNGGGPNIATEIERIVRAGQDELLRQIEALDSELLRRAFI